MITPLEIIQARKAILHNNLKLLIRILRRHRLYVYECSILKNLIQFGRFLRENKLKEPKEYGNIEWAYRQYAIMQILRGLHTGHSQSIHKKLLGERLEDITPEDEELYRKSWFVLINYLRDLEDTIRSNPNNSLDYIVRHNIAHNYPITTLKRLELIQSLEEALLDRKDVAKYREYKIQSIRVFEELSKPPEK